MTSQSYAMGKMNIFMDQGSAAAPGASFVQESRTGLFLPPGGNALSIAVQGTEVARFTEAGLVGESENVLVNGAFNVWQRGTPLAAVPSGGFMADRWQLVNTSTAIGTAQWQQNPGIPITERNGRVSTYMSFTVTTADAAVAAGDVAAIYQVIEGYDYNKIAGKYSTLSFWVVSPKTGQHYISIPSGGGGHIYLTSYVVNVANTWEWKTVIIPPFTAGTFSYTNGIGIMLRFCLMAGTTYNTGVSGTTYTSGNPYAGSNQPNCFDTISNQFALANVVLVPGTMAATLKPTSYGSEIARCQRYYEPITAGGVYMTHYAAGASNILGTFVPHKSQKGGTPTFTKSGTFAVTNCGQPFAVQGDHFGFSMGVTSSAGGLTVVQANSADDGFTSEWNPA